MMCDLWKAKRTFDKKKKKDPATWDLFATQSWCEKLKWIYQLSLRRKTTTDQKDPSYMIDWIVSYVIHMHQIQK